ncbi:MAG TPA: acyl carrier protein [Anaerolineales bacterium]|nr:acyl carrier protein [Anaerolineales bacterium]
MNEEHATALIDRIQALLVTALQVPAEEVSAGLAFGDLPQWDSMGHMEVMMALEAEFGVEINADTIAALTSIPAISAYLKDNQHA